MRSKPKPPKSKSKKQLLIVDDHPMIRKGLRQLVEDQQDLAVCGEAATAAEAMSLIETCKPDLVLADITLPDKSGLELIKDLQALHPGLPVLVISMHDESLYAERVLRAGGRGYIMKEAGGEKMLEAIRRVRSGQFYVSEEMSAKIFEGLSGRRSQAGGSPMEKLSDREFEIFQLIGQGRSTQEIASQLHLSAKTVEVHRLHIKEKLELKTSSELIRYAVRWVETQRVG
jgi:DNA-binding NarL/FixJ family response regulator